MNTYNNILTALGMANLPFASVYRDTSLGVGLTSPLEANTIAPDITSSRPIISSTTVATLGFLPTVPTNLTEGAVLTPWNTYAVSTVTESIRGSESSGDFFIASAPTRNIAAELPSTLVDGSPFIMTIPLWPINSSNTLTEPEAPDPVTSGDIIITPSPTDIAAAPSTSSTADSIPPIITIETIRTSTVNHFTTPEVTTQVSPPVSCTATAPYGPQVVTPSSSVTSEEGEITTPVPQLSPVSPATRYKAGVSTPITASKLSATAPDGPEVVTTPISALNTLAPDGPEAITPNSSTFHITPEPTGLPATLKTEEGPDSVGVITIEGPEEDLVDDE